MKIKWKRKKFTITQVEKSNEKTLHFIETEVKKNLIPNWEYGSKRCNRRIYLELPVIEFPTWRVVISQVNSDSNINTE